VRRGRKATGLKSKIVELPKVNIGEVGFFINRLNERRFKMSLFKKLFMIVVIVLLVAGIYGCKKEGPAERAGKDIDKAMEDTKEKLDDVTK
jgi:hypothetical protein